MRTALLALLLAVGGCDDGTCPDVPDASPTSAQVVRAENQPRTPLQGRLQQPDAGATPNPCLVTR